MTERKNDNRLTKVELLCLCIARLLPSRSDGLFKMFAFAGFNVNEFAFDAKKRKKSNSN